MTRTHLFLGTLSAVVVAVICLAWLNRADASSMPPDALVEQDSEESVAPHVPVEGRPRKPAAEPVSSAAPREQRLGMSETEARSAARPHPQAEVMPRVERPHSDTAIVPEAEPWRFSSEFPAPPFDRESFAEDPQAYAAEVVPGRIWHSATPGPDVPRLRLLSPAGVDVDPGGSVTVKFAAPAGAPVTVLSHNYGAFGNGQTTITVLADDAGVARAAFTAIAGTVARAHITAACPLASGQVGVTVAVRGTGATETASATGL
jgi:hypothetical protein